MGYTYHLPKGRDPLGCNYIEWETTEVLDFMEYRKNMKILVATEKPFAKKALDGIKEILQAAGYEGALLEKYILNNTHKSIVTAVPVKGLGDRKEEALAKKLADYKASLSAEEIDAIVKDTAALKLYQETPDSEGALGCIPLLTREDLRREIVPLSNKMEEIEGTPFLRHDIFTNGIGYVRLVFSAEHISTDLLAYTGILKNVLGYMDTDKHTYGDLFNEIHLYTGGISAGMVLSDDVKEKGKYRIAFEMKTKEYAKSFRVAGRDSFAYGCYR